MGTDAPRRERMSEKEVAGEYNISTHTLASWRMKLKTDKRYPRFHRYFTGQVFYFRDEFEEDLTKMEVEI